MGTTLLLEEHEMTRMLERLASQIMERHADCGHVMLVGIERRGADLAHRLAASDFHPAFRAFFQQHRHDLPRRSIAKQLAQRLLMPGNSRRIDPRDEIRRRVAPQGR